MTDHHVLIGMIDEPDCHFVSFWLAKVAEAQTLWSCALGEPDFADHVLPLHAVSIPDLAAGALEILGELEHWRRLAALALYPDHDHVRCHELALLVLLGFFVSVGGWYRMDIPERITLAIVKRTALRRFKMGVG